MKTGTAVRRWVAAALCALTLSGCGSLLERSYADSSPHVQFSDESESEAILRAETYQGLVSALLYLVGQGEEAGVIRLYQYGSITGTAASDVDRACLDAMAAAGARSKDPFIRDYENSQVAVTDIKIAVRGERTGKSREFLREALAPVEGLDVRRMAQAASEGRDSLLLFLSEHGYSEAAEAIKESPSAFERWCDNHLMKTIRPQKRNLASVGPVVAYYLARENEIRTARIILTAKANGFSEDATRERVREMYV